MTNGISLRNIFLLAMTMLPGTALSAKLKALVYKNEPDITCEDCAGDLGKLLQNDTRISVKYVGPNQLNSKMLEEADIFAYPGGPDEGDAWNDVSNHADDLEAFVRNGGVYIGVCLGAYLAGDLGILPSGVQIASEITRNKTEVHNANDTIIKVDWYFAPNNIQRERYMYFQEGAAIIGLEQHLKTGARVLARYSKNQDVAAAVTRHGKGWVGVIGTHPEADYSWYQNARITNPQGYSNTLGRQFVHESLRYYKRRKQMGAGRN